VYNRAETELRRVQARALVPTAIGIVQKDELIVDANQRITRERCSSCQSLRDLERRGGRAAISLSAGRAHGADAALRRRRSPSICASSCRGVPRQLHAGDVHAADGGGDGAAEVLVGTLGSPSSRIPLALAPLVVASLIEKRPALVFTLMLAVTTAAIMELGAVRADRRDGRRHRGLLGIATAAALALRARQRDIALANLAAMMAGIWRAPPAEQLMRDAMWGALNSFLAMSLAFLLLPVVEHLFG
jgi:membrane-associated HD superfamily phosphohydrolase